MIELAIDLPADLHADFYPDGSALLVVHPHAGRTTVHRFDIASAALIDLPVAVGMVAGASVRPDGTVWYGWSSAASPGQLRVLHPDGRDTLLLRTIADPAAGSEPVSDVWVPGPGETIHALLAVPPAAAGAGGATAPWPTVFAVHGGPAAGDEDSLGPGAVAGRCERINFRSADQSHPLVMV